jgi:hypothetical protein
MTYITAFPSLLVAALVDTAWVAVFRAKPVGKFSVLVKARRVAVLVQQRRFHHLAQGGALEMREGKNKRSVQFSEPNGMEYRVSEAMLCCRSFSSAMASPTVWRGTRIQWNGSPLLS